MKTCREGKKHVIIRRSRLRKGARERVGGRGWRWKGSQLRGKGTKDGRAGKEERKPRSWKE